MVFKGQLRFIQYNVSYIVTYPKIPEWDTKRKKVVGSAKVHKSIVLKPVGCLYTGLVQL